MQSFFIKLYTTYIGYFSYLCEYSGPPEYHLINVYFKIHQHKMVHMLYEIPNTWMLGVYMVCLFVCLGFLSFKLAKFIFSAVW